MSHSPVIHTESLSKTYRLGVARHPVEALRGLNLDVFEGEVFAFLGLNGAGKTTTIKLLLDHARPTQGSAALFGLDVRTPAARRRVGFQPDLPHFYRYLTASELLDYFGRLHGLSGSVRREQSLRLMKLVGLDRRGVEPLKGYSRGMLQRLGLAQALIADPALIILDEPLGGLDPMGRAELRDIIAGLKREGRTVFFSSHILDDAQRIADRVGILHRGRLLACGTLKDILGRQPGWEIELLASSELDLPRLCQEHSWRLTPNGAIQRIVIDDDAGVGLLMAEILRTGARLESLNRRRLSLEDAFLAELTRASQQ